MRSIVIVTLLALFALDSDALARGRTGQARSVEVLAKRTADSPRGAKGWAGKSAAFVSKSRVRARAQLRGATPGDTAMWQAIGKLDASVGIREIVGKELGMTPGQISSKDRRHDRAIKKELRRMIRQVRTARASGIPVARAFPGALSPDYSTIEAKLTEQLVAIDRRQVDSRRTDHPAKAAP
jgi:hypothetical protein